MRVADALEKTNISDYTKALMSTESHKNCVGLARSINKSHDALYKPFKDPILNKNIVHEKLLSFAKEQFGENKIYLVFDDSRIAKPHAKEIEGLDVGFDGSTGHTELGLQMLSALLTDGNVKIPVDMVPYFSKLIAGTYYKTKSALATDMYMHLVELFMLAIVIADAHYATKQLLALFHKLRQQFLMKLPCNRIVQIGKTVGQLKEIFRLRRNEHIRITQGIFNGLSYYFYVVKIKPGCIAYFISLLPLSADELSRLYKIRWGIELFHRTAKQSLGWKDCQMRAIEKHELHSFYVMYAYAIAELVRIKLKLETTEDAIRALWNIKDPVHGAALYAAGENLC